MLNEHPTLREKLFSAWQNAGKAATFLSDAGYITHLLRSRLFDTLSTQDRVGLELHNGEHGALEDGS